MKKLLGFALTLNIQVFGYFNVTVMNISNQKIENSKIELLSGTSVISTINPASSTQYFNYLSSCEGYTVRVSKLGYATKSLPCFEGSTLEFKLNVYSYPSNGMMVNSSSKTFTNDYSTLFLTKNPQYNNILHYFTLTDYNIHTNRIESVSPNNEVIVDVAYNNNAYE